MKTIQANWVTIWAVILLVAVAWIMTVRRYTTPGVVREGDQVIADVVRSLPVPRPKITATEVQKRVVERGRKPLEVDLPTARAMERDLYLFKPTLDEMTTLQAMALQVRSIRGTPEPAYHDQYVGILDSVQSQLGPERAKELWRALEPGTAQVAKLIDTYGLPANTLERFEELRTWGKAQRADGADGGFQVEREFLQRLAEIIGNEEAFKQIELIAPTWLGAEGPSDYGFGK